MSTLKDSISQAVEHLADELDALSRQIHAHPELAYHEVQACGWLSDFLARQGFKVEKGVGGVETAFRGTIETGEGPTIAILCEYDALPGIGHACGHNVIATSGVGAGAALAAVRAQLPKGRIQVIGTPAEEGGGGKVKLIKSGVFREVDCAMMIHGFDRTLLHQDLLGIVRGTFEFNGRASHASADPWEGVNALDAVIQTYNAISMLRQQVRPNCRIHGIITNGGAAANIIPEYASAIFYVRAPRIDTMWELFKRVTPRDARPVRGQHEDGGPYRGRPDPGPTRLLRHRQREPGDPGHPADGGHRPHRHGHPHPRLRGRGGEAAGARGHGGGGQDHGPHHPGPARRARPGEGGEGRVRQEQVTP